jgi:hypothetical protein
VGEEPVTPNLDPYRPWLHLRGDEVAPTVVVVVAVA